MPCRLATQASLQSAIRWHFIWLQNSPAIGRNFTTCLPFGDRESKWKWQPLTFGEGKMALARWRLTGDQGGICGKWGDCGWPSFLERMGRGMSWVIIGLPQRWTVMLFWGEAWWLELLKAWIFFLAPLDSFLAFNALSLFLSPMIASTYISSKTKKLFKKRVPRSNYT